MRQQSRCDSIRFDCCVRLANKVKVCELSCFHCRLAENTNPFLAWLAAVLHLDRNVSRGKDKMMTSQSLKPLSTPSPFLLVIRKCTLNVATECSFCILLVPCLRWKGIDAARQTTIRETASRQCTLSPRHSLPALTVSDFGFFQIILNLKSLPKDSMLFEI